VGFRDEEDRSDFLANRADERVLAILNDLTHKKRGCSGGRGRAHNGPEG